MNENKTFISFSDQDLLRTLFFPRTSRIHLKVFFLTFRLVRQISCGYHSQHNLYCLFHPLVTAPTFAQLKSGSSFLH